MEVLRELGSEVVWELTHETTKLLIELVQFVILVFVIKMVAFGFGKREGMLVGMLGRRRERVAAQIEAADAQERNAAEAPAEAHRLVEEARREAKGILAQARASATRERERIDAEAAEQAAELARQAEDTLVHERDDVLNGVRDVLLDVVARATRQVLDEGYSAGQQREMIESAILESIDDLESVAIR